MFDNATRFVLSRARIFRDNEIISFALALIAASVPSPARPDSRQS
jgi:hypothetical protein